MCLHYCLRESSQRVIWVSVFGCPITRWEVRAIYGATRFIGIVSRVAGEFYAEYVLLKKEYYLRGITVLPRYEHDLCALPAVCLSQQLNVLTFLTL